MQTGILFIYFQPRKRGTHVKIFTFISDREKQAQTTMETRLTREEKIPMMTYNKTPHDKHRERVFSSIYLRLRVFICLFCCFSVIVLIQIPIICTSSILRRRGRGRKGRQSQVSVSITTAYWKTILLSLTNDVACPLDILHIDSFIWLTIKCYFMVK